MPSFMDSKGIASVRDIISMARSRSSGRNRREAEATVPNDDRRDAVPAGDRAPGVPLDLGVVVGVEVDEAGGDDQASGVQLMLGRRAAEATDASDVAVLDRDVCLVARNLGPVDDGSTTDEDVEICHRSPRFRLGSGVAAQS